ncbi:hypothetical protein GMOD_00003672 [Pyrenophora seminiperda CCB06]|uniref:Uncharacterized protein n=1 Tax=Pyrenophora seminiperda CCB06 TaxID=1302712 RepID=A0A3M7MJK1_9PLEO|nr:hypothetical protein GMOD_00003672 [Pyrenophora seminiperda CCB06]
MSREPLTSELEVKIIEILSARPLTYDEMDTALGGFDTGHERAFATVLNDMTTMIVNGDGKLEFALKPLYRPRGPTPAEFEAKIIEIFSAGARRLTLDEVMAATGAQVHFARGHHRAFAEVLRYMTETFENGDGTVEFALKESFLPKAPTTAEPLGSAESVQEEVEEEEQVTSPRGSVRSSLGSTESVQEEVQEEEQNVEDYSESSSDEDYAVSEDSEELGNDLMEGYDSPVLTPSPEYTPSPPAQQSQSPVSDDAPLPGSGPTLSYSSILSLAIVPVPVGQMQVQPHVQIQPQLQTTVSDNSPLPGPSPVLNHPSTPSPVIAPAPVQSAPTLTTSPLSSPPVSTLNHPSPIPPPSRPVATPTPALVQPGPDNEESFLSEPGSILDHPSPSPAPVATKRRRTEENEESPLSSPGPIPDHSSPGLAHVATKRRRTEENGESFLSDLGSILDHSSPSPATVAPTAPVQPGPDNEESFLSDPGSILDHSSPIPAPVAPKRKSAENSTGEPSAKRSKTTGAPANKAAEAGNVKVQCNGTTKKNARCKISKQMPAGTETWNCGRHG